MNLTTLQAIDGGTAMDMFASDISFPPANTLLGYPASGALVRDKIAAAGGEFSRNVNTMERMHSRYQCRQFARELDELTLFPELFER